MLGLKGLQCYDLNSNEPGTECVLTNKKNAHWCGCVAPLRRRKWHGLVSQGHMIFSQFSVQAGSQSSSNIANEQTWTHSVLGVHGLRRTYSLHEGAHTLQEEIFLPEGQNVALFRYRTNYSGEMLFTPQFDLRPSGWNLATHEYQAEWLDASAALSISHAQYDGHVVLRADTLVRCQSLSTSDSATFAPHHYDLDLLRGEAPHGESFQPAVLSVEMHPDRPVTFSVAWGSDLKTALDEAWEACNAFDEHLDQKQKRLQNLLFSQTGTENSPAHWPLLSFSDQELSTSIAWAFMSLDSLVMEAFGKGIYAGLPWFDQVWGRDQFHSFRGALLKTGEFSSAKKVLLRWLGAVDLNLQSSTLGRIPNYIGFEKTIYNSADATPLFLLAVSDYIMASGDREFLREHFAEFAKMISLNLETTNSQGLFLHSSQETWMDAQVSMLFENGKSTSFVCSPRANCAVEIQAFWFHALNSLCQIAERSTLPSSQLQVAESWHAAATKLKNSFQEKFWNAESQSLCDHLKPDLSRDTAQRPNVLFAFHGNARSTKSAASFSLLEHEQEKLILNETLKSHLIVPWGVRSLAPESVFFHPEVAQMGASFQNDYCKDGVVYYHPYHEYGTRHGLDHPDWSYHNGDVWQWLSGVAVEALVAFNQLNTAANLTQTLSRHLLHGGTLGTLAELMDGDCAEHAFGWDKGAISQAWSLAEYVRVFFDAYLGLRCDAGANTVQFQPSFPEDWGTAKFTVHMGQGHVYVEWNMKQNMGTALAVGFPASTPVVLDLFERKDQGSFKVQSFKLENEIKKAIHKS